MANNTTPLLLNSSTEDKGQSFAIRQDHNGDFCLNIINYEGGGPTQLLHINITKDPVQVVQNGGQYFLSTPGEINDITEHPIQLVFHAVDFNDFRSYNGVITDSNESGSRKKIPLNEIVTLDVHSADGFVVAGVLHLDETIK